MRVLVVSHVDNLSGANKSMISVMKKLNKKVDFTLLTNGNSKEFIDEIEKINIEVITTEYGWWYAKPRISKLKSLYRIIVDAKKYYAKRKINKRFLDIIEKKQFDLIYTNTSTIDIGYKLSKLLNIPHIWHIREFGEEDFGFKCIVNNKYKRECFKNSAAIITISQALKNKYSTFVDINKLYLVHNGFDTSKLYCSPKKHDLNKKINVLITGQVCEAKGQEQAIRAVNILKNKGYPIKLFIAGDVDKDYINNILTNEIDKDCIAILGRVNDMYGLRKNMDIELVCSRCEAFGRVTIEAMLHGIPVIGANSGGTRELINSGENGLLYEEGNSNNLAEKIELLIKNETLYNNIINNAYSFSLGLTIENTANAIYQIFKYVVNGKRE